MSWDRRPIFGSSEGLPWWAAILLGFGMAILGAVIDFQLQDTLGRLFQGCYFVGSVAAVAWVQRRHLFGPMVQPPLILAITVPGVVLLASGIRAGADTLTRVFAVSTPLINGFPTMAITTVATLAIGIFRIYRERDPERGKAGSKAGSKAKPKPGAPGGRRKAKAALTDEATRLAAPVDPQKAGRRSGAVRAPKPGTAPTGTDAALAAGAPAGRRSAATPKDPAATRARRPVAPKEQATQVRRAVDPEQSIRGRRPADPDQSSRLRRALDPEPPPTRARRPVDPPTPQQPRPQGNRARPLDEGEPRPTRGRRARSDDAPWDGGRADPRPPSGRWRAPGEVPRRPAPDAPSPGTRRTPPPPPPAGDQPTPRRRRQPPPPNPRPWDKDDQG